MNQIQKAYLQLHIAVLLYGFTAILGDLIQLNALMLVWWRVFITSLSLAILFRLRNRLSQIPRLTILKYMGIGVLIALHWVGFYGSIKLANASIALIAMATTSFFSALIEPFVIKRSVYWYELALGLLIIPGMILIVNGSDFDLIYGLLVGLVAAFLAALFTSLNKKLISEADEMSITFLELGSAWLFLSVVIPVYALATPGQALKFWPDTQDWFYLLLLSLLCTTFAYVISLRALRHLSAFASTLTINLEPVYGIILAWIILKEYQELSTGFYLGVGVILLAVFSYPYLKKRFQTK